MVEQLPRGLEGERQRRAVLDDAVEAGGTRRRPRNAAHRYCRAQLRTWYRRRRRHGRSCHWDGRPAACGSAQGVPSRRSGSAARRAGAARRWNGWHRAERESRRYPRVSASYRGRAVPPCRCRGPCRWRRQTVQLGAGIAVASSNPSRLSPSAKRAAARIGPTVWELDGPMPILNRSKTLRDMLVSACGLAATMAALLFNQRRPGSAGRIRRPGP